jgi:hypothetical protein
MQAWCVVTAALLAFVGGVCADRLHAQPATTVEQSAIVETEDTQRLCPYVSAELAAKVVAALKGMSQCEVHCSGCGCKGGPGYRSRSTGHCVGWGEIVSVCGPPPHQLCDRECEPVVAGCTGRAWVKALAAKSGLAVPFMQGKKREKPGNSETSQADRGSAPQQLLDGVENSEGNSGVACGTKRTCGEMANCAEAFHYLRDCGLTRLDGDGDGIPCNSKCKGRKR